MWLLMLPLWLIKLQLEKAPPKITFTKHQTIISPFFENEVSCNLSIFPSHPPSWGRHSKTCWGNVQVFDKLVKSLAIIFLRRKVEESRSENYSRDPHPHTHTSTKLSGDLQAKKQNSKLEIGRFIGSNFDKYFYLCLCFKCWQSVIWFSTICPALLSDGVVPL